MIEQEHREELIREYVQEVKAEPMHIWINDNKSMLVDEYISINEDDFNIFCKDIYNNEVD